jgi:hypothetical protein
VSSTGSPCYVLASFLCKILSPLGGNQESFFKYSGHFVQLLKSVNLQSLDTLVSFDVVRLFTNLPVNKALQVIKNKLHNDDTLAEQSVWRSAGEPHIFRWMTGSSNKKMTRLWEPPYHPSLATSSWSTSRNWLLTRHNTNRHCGSSILMTHLWSDLMVQSGYRTSSATSIV